MSHAAVCVAEAEAERWTAVEIDLLCPSDWPLLRSARLAALSDSPDAFVASSAAEAKRSPEEWIISIKSSTWAVARDDGEVVGIARLVVPVVGAPTERFIESVWITPEHRRRGLVRKMLSRLESEARADEVDYLNLWVFETNDSAYDAYVKLGFSEVPEMMQDSWKSQADGAWVQERLMVKPLL